MKIYKIAMLILLAASGFITYGQHEEKARKALQELSKGTFLEFLPSDLEKEVLKYIKARDLNEALIELLQNQTAIPGKQEEQYTAIRKLVEAGAPLNQKDSQGYTPLWYAMGYPKLSQASYSSSMQKLVELLLENGADPNIPSPTGETLLHALIRQPVVNPETGQEESLSAHAPIVRLLRKYGAL